MSGRRKADLFKAFTLKPFAASTKTGEVLDLAKVMGGIKKRCRHAHRLSKLVP